MRFEPDHDRRAAGPGLVRSCLPQSLVSWNIALSTLSPSLDAENAKLYNYVTLAVVGLLLKLFLGAVVELVSVSTF